MLIDSFKNRLAKAMEMNGLKQVDIVEKTGIDKTLLNKYLSGKTNAKQSKLTTLALALGVSETWLMRI